MPLRIIYYFKITEMKNLTPIIEIFFPFPYLNSICVINIAIIVFMRIFAVFRVRVWIRTHFACWIRIHIWNADTVLKKLTKLWRKRLKVA